MFITRLAAKSYNTVKSGFKLLFGKGTRKAAKSIMTPVETTAKGAKNSVVKMGADAEFNFRLLNDADPANPLGLYSYHNYMW